MVTRSVHNFMAGGAVWLILGGALAAAGFESEKGLAPVAENTAPGLSSSAFGHGGRYWVFNQDKFAPGPVPGIDHASIHFGRFGEGMAYVLWTDLYQPSGGGGAASSFDPRRSIRY